MDKEEQENTFEANKLQPIKEMHMPCYSKNLGFSKGTQKISSNEIKSCAQNLLLCEFINYSFFF